MSAVKDIDTFKAWANECLMLCIVLILGSSLLLGAPPPKPGDPAPDFQLQDLKAETVRLSSLKGKPVVLHFWATWCPHCLSEMPLLQDLGRDLEAGGARVLAVNLGEPKRKVERYALEHHLDLKILLDARGKAAQAFGVIGLPATVIVDAQGRIKGQIDMGSLTRDSLNRILASPDEAGSPH